jgi:hypothetical protein
MFLFENIVCIYGEEIPQNYRIFSCINVLEKNFKILNSSPEAGPEGK